MSSRFRTEIANSFRLIFIVSKRNAKQMQNNEGALNTWPWLFKYNTYHLSPCYMFHDCLLRRINECQVFYFDPLIWHTYIYADILHANKQTTKTQCKLSSLGLHRIAYFNEPFDSIFGGQRSIQPLKSIINLLSRIFYSSSRKPDSKKICFRGQHASMIPSFSQSRNITLNLPKSYIFKLLVSKT